MPGSPDILCLMGVSNIPPIGRGERLTKIHDMVSADGAVVDNDVPSPQGDSVPLLQSVLPSPALYREVPPTYLLDLKLLLVGAFADDTVGLFGGHRGIAHFDVSHVRIARDFSGKLWQ